MLGRRLFRIAVLSDTIQTSLRRWRGLRANTAPPRLSGLAALVRTLSHCLMQTSSVNRRSRLLGYLLALAAAELLLTASLWQLGWNGTITATVRVVIGIGCLLLLAAAIYLLIRWRRARFRFSLRALFLGVTAICVLFGTFGAHYIRIAQDRALVRTLSSLGIQDVWLEDVDAEKPTSIDTDVSLLEFHLRKAPLSQQLFLINFNSDVAVRDGLPLLQKLPRVSSILICGAASDAAMAALDDKLDMLPQIRGIQVDQANISDQGLASIAHHKQLNSLWLFEHQVTDQGLVHIGKMANLETLALMDDGTNGRTSTRITAKGLAQLRHIPRLKRLIVSGLNVGDDGLAQIGYLTSVEDLMLKRAHITDTGIIFLRSMGNLRKLTIIDCPISDDGLMQLIALSNLRSLSLGLTQVSDAGVDTFRSARPDCDVTLSK